MRRASRARARAPPPELLRLAEAATAGRLDHEHVARLHLRRADVVQLLDAPVRADHRVAPDLARLAAAHAEGAVVAAVAQDRRRHRFEEAHLARPAVAAAPLAGTT